MIAHPFRKIFQRKLHWSDTLVRWVWFLGHVRTPCLQQQVSLVLASERGIISLLRWDLLSTGVGFRLFIRCVRWAFLPSSELGSWCLGKRLGLKVGFGDLFYARHDGVVQFNWKCLTSPCQPVNGFYVTRARFCGGSCLWHPYHQLPRIRVWVGSNCAMLSPTEAKISISCGLSKSGRH